MTDFIPRDCTGDMIQKYHITGVHATTEQQSRTKNSAAQDDGTRRKTA
jgi:hypothetical protein